MERNIVCKFKLSKNLNTETPPFLVNFSNGQLNLNSTKKLDFTCYRRVEDENIVNSDARRLLIASNGRLCYKSTTLEENCDAKELSQRYFIGVRNKRNNHMKIYGSIPFHMKPVLSTIKESSPTPDMRSSKQKYDELTLNFGSKGKKRAMAIRMKHNDTFSSPAGDNHEQMQQVDSPSASPEHSELTCSTPATIDYIPPQNFDAVFVNEVYNIRDIISLEEDAQLTDEAETLLQEWSNHISKWKYDGTYCKYVLAHLENDVPDIEKVKYLIYYNYLVIFANLQSIDMKKKDPAPAIPEPFKSKMLDYFTVSSKTKAGRTTRNLPQKIKDKLLAHLFVLALFIDDYVVNIALIQRDLKVSIQKVTSIAQVIGCHVNQHKVQNALMKFAELKLPLYRLEGSSVRSVMYRKSRV